MKILYISSPSFFDMDLSLAKRMNKNTDFYYFLDLPNYMLNSPAISIKNQLNIDEIISINNYSEFDKYSEYLNFDKSFIINRTSSKFYSLKNLKLQYKLLKCIKKISPDIIHCNNDLNMNFLSVLLNSKYKKIVTIHDPIFHSGEGSFRDSFNRWMSIKLIRNFILLNISQNEEFIKTNNVANDSVYISSIGVYEYIKLFNNTNNTNNNKDLVLFFGRISPYKGINYLLESFSNISSQFPELKLVIAGSGNYNFDITPYKNNTKIIFMNHYIENENLFNLLNKSLLVVCPYTDATQSGVVMTSYAMSVPILSTNTGALKETVLNNITGNIISAKSTTELTEMLKYLLNNKQILANYTKNIENIYFTGDKSWDFICEKLIIIYNTLLNKS